MSNLDDALLDAAEKGDASLVIALIMRGANKNAKGFRGRAALHLAASNGHVDVVTKLCELGCDKNARDNCLYTALHWAAINGHVDVVGQVFGAKNFLANHEAVIADVFSR